MVSRKKTDDQQSSGLSEASAELEIVPVGGEFDAEPMRETILVYHLPNFAQDRRSDLRAARVKVGSIDDLTRFDELFRVYASKAGFYLQEHRIGGQVAETKVVEVKARVETLSDATSAPQGAAQPRQLGELAGAAREFIGLAEVLRPPAPPVAPLTAADAERIAADAAARAVEAYKAAQPATPAAAVDPFSFVERSMHLQEQMRAQAMASNPTAQQNAPPDPTDTFLNQYEKFTAISERINPNGEARSGWGNVASIIKDVVGIGKEVAPLAMAIISGGRAQAMAQSMGLGDAAPPAESQPQAAQTPAAPATQPTQPQALNEPQNENEAFALIAVVAVNDLIKNKRVGRTADLIEDMAARFPALVPMVDQFCTMEPEAALTTLGQFTQRNDLLTFRHSRNWILDLIEELTPEDDGDEPDATHQPDAAPSIVEMASTQAQ